MRARRRAVSLGAALSQSQALLLLFVGLPVALGVVVMVLVARAPGPPPGTRTSELLAHGEPAPAEVRSARALGSVIDLRPMARVVLWVSPAEAEPFELAVVQAMTRRELAELQPGRQVTVRLSADRNAGAVEL